jgi:hypothetical protein
MARQVQIRSAEDDLDDAGYFRRKALRLQRLGIRAVGPTSLHPPPPPPPSRADEIVARRRRSQLEREHSETISKELAAVDARIGEIEKLLVALGADNSYHAQELRGEARQLRELRIMLELDRDPILTDRDGRELTDRDRAIVRLRARELCESYWAAAARDDACGDYREGRRHRLAAIASRMIAEDEMKLRGTVPGFGLCAWN